MNEILDEVTQATERRRVVPGLLSDTDISKLLMHKELVISPVSLSLVTQNEKKEKIISYGLGSTGYDLSLGRNFKVFNNVNNTIVDPKNFSEDCVTSFINVDCCIIPPNSYVLGESVEYIKMPNNVMGLCIGKSSYARCGIIVPMTPLEAAWAGKLTIEISNSTPLPAKVYAGEGICQILFFRTTMDVNCTYADRNGKYQNQLGLTLPRL